MYAKVFIDDKEIVMKRSILRKEITQFSDSVIISGATKNQLACVIRKIFYKASFIRTLH